MGGEEGATGLEGAVDDRRCGEANSSCRIACPSTANPALK